MELCKLYLYKGKPVFVTKGSVSINGRISNCWTFHYINSDGTLGKKDSDYDNEEGKFVKVNEKKYSIIIKEK